MTTFSIGNHVRVEHPLGHGDLHGLIGVITGFTEIFAGNAWHDGFHVHPDKPQFPGEQLAVLGTWLRNTDGGEQR